MFLNPTCPQCGKTPLFASLLSVRKKCDTCGLALGKHDAGDGPAFFGIVIVGFAVMTLAGMVEYHFAPPMWVHAALWIPMIFIGSILCLRLFKAYLIVLEYRLRALREQREDGKE